MFVIKKIISAFLMPLPIGIFLLFLAFLYLLFNSYKKAKLFLFLGLFWFLLLFFQPISNAIIKPLENAHESLLNIPKVEYILVLGSSHTSNDNLSLTSQLSPVAINRLSEGIRIYKELGNAKLILSGYGAFDKNSHALMLEKLAISLGVKKEDIIRFDTTKDTKEEVIETKKLLGNKDFILVTSASHMKRANLLFKKEGLSPYLAPTYHLGNKTQGFDSYFSGRNLFKVEIAFHEYEGLIFSWLKNEI